MKLDEFVGQTLIQIIQGVRSAQKTAEEHGVTELGYINPRPDHVKYVVNYQTPISFDIAITVTDESRSDIKGGIQVVGIGIGGKDESSSQNSTVSRVSFNLPVVFPFTSVGEMKLDG